MQIRSYNGQSRTEALRNPSESPEHVPRAEGAKLNWTGHTGVVWTIRAVIGLCGRCRLIADFSNSSLGLQVKNEPIWTVLCGRNASSFRRRKMSCGKIFPHWGCEQDHELCFIHRTRAHTLRDAPTKSDCFHILQTILQVFWEFEILTSTMNESSMPSPIDWPSPV